MALPGGNRRGSLPLIASNAAAVDRRRRVREQRLIRAEGKTQQARTRRWRAAFRLSSCPSKMLDMYPLSLSGRVAAARHLSARDLLSCL